MSQPPFLGAWRNIYIAIAAYLIAVIAFLTWMTRSASR